MFRFYLRLLAENKAWLKKTAGWAVFWFGMGMLVFAMLPETAPRFLEFLERVFREILGGKELTLDFSSVWLIFKNNFQASLIVLFGGIILGLVPLGSMAINFFIFGYTLTLFSSQKGVEGLGIFLLSVVPHGIVEMPLFLLAAAFGLRLGFFWRIAEPVSGWRKLIICLRDNLRLVPLLFIGLFAAALLEVFVSGRLAMKM